LLFASLVSQQAQMALMFLGQGSATEGSEPSVNLDMARVCIDTLEMLEAKTRGNLAPAESEFLQHELMTLRMCFVETVEAGKGTPKPATAPDTAQAKAQSATERAASPADETRKRFVKKYGADAGKDTPPGPA